MKQRRAATEIKPAHAASEPPPAVGVVADAAAKTAPPAAVEADGPASSSGRAEKRAPARPQPRQAAIPPIGGSVLAMLEKSAQTIWRPFARCNFSRRTIAALVAQGIDTPERLLLTSWSELRCIEGVDLAEIRAYRARRNLHEDAPRGLPT
jgi:hypothetical protein